MADQIFEWDEEKARQNVLKHGVSFESAMTIFNDPFGITIADPAHSEMEDRWIDVGADPYGTLLVVWYTERGSTIRIIGCRVATNSERRNYEDERNFKG